jgi:hypothetical protein
VCNTGCFCHEGQWKERVTCAAVSTLTSTAATNASWSVVELQGMPRVGNVFAMFIAGCCVGTADCS